jgi:hypothetical protein
MSVAMQRLVDFIPWGGDDVGGSHSSYVPVFFSIPFYLQAVQIHSANGVKLLEA